MKTTLPWFEHDAAAHEHGKFMMLRTAFGWAGEGRFWALNGMIAQADGCWLDISKPAERFRIAGTLNMTTAELDAFIAFLADPEACGLVIRDGDRITTETVQACFARVETKRLKERERKEAQRKRGESSQGKKQESHGTSEPVPQDAPAIPPESAPETEHRDRDSNTASNEAAPRASAREAAAPAKKQKASDPLIESACELAVADPAEADFVCFFDWFKAAFRDRYRAANAGREYRWDAWDEKTIQDIWRAIGQKPDRDAWVLLCLDDLFGRETPPRTIRYCRSSIIDDYAKKERVQIVNQAMTDNPRLVKKLEEFLKPFTIEKLFRANKPEDLQRAYDRLVKTAPDYPTLRKKFLAHFNLEDPTKSHRELASA